MSISQRNSCSEISSRCPSNATPALLNRIVARPCCFRHLFRKRLHLRFFRHVHDVSRHFPRRSVPSRAMVSSSPFSLTSANASDDPFAANCCARHRPIPEPAPVITATPITQNCHHATSFSRPDAGYSKSSTRIVQHQHPIRTVRRASKRVTFLYSHQTLPLRSAGRTTTPSISSSPSTTSPDARPCRGQESTRTHTFPLGLSSLANAANQLPASPCNHLLVRNPPKIRPRLHQPSQVHHLPPACPLHRLNPVIFRI